MHFRRNFPMCVRMHFSAGARRVEAINFSDQLADEIFRRRRLGRSCGFGWRCELDIKFVSTRRNGLRFGAGFSGSFRRQVPDSSSTGSASAEASSTSSKVGSGADSSPSSAETMSCSLITSASGGAGAGAGLSRSACARVSSGISAASGIGAGSGIDAGSGSSAGAASCGDDKREPEARWQLAAKRADATGAFVAVSATS